MRAPTNPVGNGVAAVVVVKWETEIDTSRMTRGPEWWNWGGEGAGNRGL